jgi:hypothetical protein
MGFKGFKNFKSFKGFKGFQGFKGVESFKGFKGFLACSSARIELRHAKVAITKVGQFFIAFNLGLCFGNVGFLRLHLLIRLRACAKPLQNGRTQISAW